MQNYCTYLISYKMLQIFCSNPSVCVYPFGLAHECRGSRVRETAMASVLEQRIQAVVETTEYAGLGGNPNSGLVGSRERTV